MFRGWFFPIVAGVTTGLVGLGMFTLVDGDDQSSLRTPPGVVGPGNFQAMGGFPAPGTPCEDAKILTGVDQIDPAQHHYLARDHKVDRMWTCHGIPYLVFGEVQVDVSKGFDDPSEIERSFADMSKEWGGYVTRIQGFPAQVDPAVEEDGSYTAILVAVNGDLVKLIGTRKATVDEVLAAASSLDFDQRP